MTATKNGTRTLVSILSAFLGIFLALWAMGVAHTKDQVSALDRRNQMVDAYQTERINETIKDTKANEANINEIHLSLTRIEFKLDKVLEK